MSIDSESGSVEGVHPPFAAAREGHDTTEGVAEDFHRGITVRHSLSTYIFSYYYIFTYICTYNTRADAFYKRAKRLPKKKKIFFRKYNSIFQLISHRLYQIQIINSHWQ